MEHAVGYARDDATVGSIVDARSF